MNALEEAYLMGKQAGLAAKLLHKVHAPLHFGAHQAAHKKVHHAVVPGHGEKKKVKTASHGAGLVQLATAPVWAPPALAARAIGDERYGLGGGLIGGQAGALGGGLTGLLMRRGSGIRGLAGAGLGLLGGAGLGYGIGKALED